MNFDTLQIEASEDDLWAETKQYMIIRCTR
jgi:hypothetical protein